MTLHTPTMLSDEKVSEFIALYKKRYRIALSEQDAHDTALRLMQVVCLVYKDNPAFIKK